MVAPGNAAREARICGIWADDERFMHGLKMGGGRRWRKD
jgi:hypothetical protein